jgi:hypothetical protein
VTKLEAAQFGRIVVSVVRDYVNRRLEVIAEDLRSGWMAASATVNTVKDDLAAVRERVAVVETRAPVPGPPGVGFDDLLVEYDGERSFTFKCVRGAVVKELGTFKMPISIYRQVWTDGRTYELGDSVTWAGSEWHCHTTTTTKPGDGSKAWTLKVKRGRDGKDSVDR